MNRRFIGIIALIAVVTASIALLPDVARAEEGGRVANFFKRLLVYPFSATKKTAEVATETTKKGAETVVKTGEAAVKTVTGDVKEGVPGLVVEPIKGSAETGWTAVEGSVTMPVEAAKETDEMIK